MAKKITDWDAWFWSKVDKTPNCWLWVGDRLKLGYGKVPPKHEPTWRSRYAHRISYEMLVGPIPDKAGKLDRGCRECKREYVRRRRARVRSEQCLIEHTPGEPMRLTIKITEAVNA